jgi:hypothetical protein
MIPAADALDVGADAGLGADIFNVRNESQADFYAASAD